jgi:hypothetical protein
VQLGRTGVGDTDKLLASVLPGTDGDPASIDQGAQVAGEGRLVEGRKLAEVALAYFPGVTQVPQKGVLCRAQADVAQLFVVQAAHRPRRLAKGVAKTEGGGRFESLAVHVKCICGWQTPCE